MNKYFDEDWK